MSHVVQIETRVRDVGAMRAACGRLGLAPPVHRTVRLFSESVSGWAVELPKWRYPVVFNIESGETRFDNYEGHWGDRSKLDQLLQTYAVEKTKIEARKKGHSVTERALDNGSIKLTVSVGGGAA